MKKMITVLLLYFFVLLSPQPCFSQKNGKEKIKKANVLPVYLTYSGLSNDISMDSMVKEAFNRRTVKLIDKKEFDKKTEDEVNRIVGKFRLRNFEYSEDRELREAIAKEHKYVANMLTVRFYIQNTGDTVNVIGASWTATPYPPSFYGPHLSSGKIDTDLTDVCCSTRDNIFAIIDKIVFSKWLQ